MSVTVKSTSHVTTQSTGSNTAQVIPQGPPGVGGGGGAVNSVNGKAGTVVLNAGDVGAEPAGAVAAHVAAADPHPAYVKAASLATVATSGAYGDLTGKPTLGTAAPLDVPASGDASSSQVVKGDDTRLTNERTPTAHTHTASDISDSTTAGRALLTASDASAQRAALGVPSGSGTSTGTNTGDETLARIGGLLNSASAPGAPAGTTDQVVGLTAASSFSTVERWSLASIRNAFVPTYDIRYVLASNLSTDGTLYANSDTLVPSQKAVKTYADQLIAAADVMVFKGVIDCSTNPNYPAADAGWTYRVSVAGKIGGASGVNVEIGDLLLCLTDATASGNQATVGANWSVSQTNIDGAVIGPTSVADGDVALFNGVTGKLIKSGGKLVDTVLTSLSTATNAVITAADSILTALGKLQKQISDNLTTLTNHTGNTSNPHATTAAQVGAAASGAVTTSGLTMSTARLLGRTTAATGAVEEITPGANLSLVAGSLAVTPSGTSKQIQYNNAGTLGGVPQFEFDAATNELRLGVGLTYNNNTGTLTLRQKPGGSANLFEVRDSSDLLTLFLNDNGSHLAPQFLDTVNSLRTTGYIENSGRYVDSALGYSSGGTGDVLIISTASPAESKIATVAEREKTPLGVGAFANAPYWSTYRGKETVNADSGAIAIGDRLVMSATTDGFVCADTTNNIALATVGYALSAKAGGSPGTITAWIHPTPGYKTLTVESLTTVGVVKQTVYTVATLPSASTSGNGARSHVSDALSPTFGATVAAGGSVSTPVYSDGTNWKVG